MGLGPDDAGSQRLMGPLNQTFGPPRADPWETLGFAHLSVVVS